MGRRVGISNEEKVLFPRAGLTKGDLAAYHERVADVLLPHLADRPLVLQRFPDGIEREGFYQKQAGPHPAWIPTVRVDLRSRAGAQDLLVCSGRATLRYLSNLATVTIHPWLSRRDRLDHPDLLVVDLDPPGDDFEAARRAALRVRDLLEELGLPSYPKLTGSRGLHVAVPLRRVDGFDTVRRFARSAMDVLAARHPEELTTALRKRRRGRRVYLDVARNAFGQTVVAPWSVRPLPAAPVAAPLSWGDVERRDLGPRDVTVRSLSRHLSPRDDPWFGMARRARTLDEAARRLGRLRRAVP